MFLASTSRVQVSATTGHLESNLARLPAAVRRALEAQTGGPAARDARGQGPDGLTVTTADGRAVAIHRADDPVAAAHAIAARLVEQGAPSVLIVIGPGLGYLLDAIEQTPLSTKVLALEPLAAVARAMLSRRDWSHWLTSGRLTLLVGPDYHGAAEAWRLFKPSDGRPGIIMSPVIGQEFPAEADRAKAVVRQILGGVRSNVEARRQFAGRYLLNTLANLPAIASEGDVRALDNVFAGAPAVVVDAGPSLDRHLAWLASLDGRALIIAVDTALRPLLAAGIGPHVVVAVDPSPHNARHLTHPGNTRGVWLVAEGSLDPRVIAPFMQRTFTFRISDHEPWPWLVSLGADRGHLRACGSVLTTAFDLACVAGCDPIVFAGADLTCPGGPPRCRDTVSDTGWRDVRSDEDRVKVTARLFAEPSHPVVRDVHGRDVYTTPHHVRFRDWIVCRAAEVGDRRIANVTGAGILYGGPIEQATPEALTLPASAACARDAIHAGLAAAWTNGADQRDDVSAFMADALAAAAALPMNAWLRAGAGRVTADDISGAVRSAAVGLQRRVGAARAGARWRSQADGEAGGDPAGSAEAVRVHLAHLLLELLQGPDDPAPAARTLDVVRAATRLPEALRVLVFGCGTGQAMATLSEAGHAVDGVDVSPARLDRARTRPSLARSRFHLSRGTDCGDAPDGAYDLAISTDAIHRIASRFARRAILHAMARALKPGGTLSVQLLFDPHRRADTLHPPARPWSADHPDDAAGSDPRVWTTPDELPLVYGDFAEHLIGVRFQVLDAPSGAGRRLIVSGTVAAAHDARPGSR